MPHVLSRARISNAFPRSPRVSHWKQVNPANAPARVEVSTVTSKCLSEEFLNHMNHL
jgi:hypothetical protein